MVEQSQNFLQKNKYLMLEIMSFSSYRSEAIFILRNLSKRGLQISKDPYLNNIMEPNDLHLEIRKSADLDLLSKAYKYTQCMNMPMCLNVEVYPEDVDGDFKVAVHIKDLFLYAKNSIYID